MRAYPGLWWSSVALLVGGVAFFIASVAGVFWPKPTPIDDLGLYAVTVVMLGFGIAGMLLRAAKLHPPTTE